MFKGYSYMAKEKEFRKIELIAGNPGQEGYKDGNANEDLFENIG